MKRICTHSFSLAKNGSRIVETSIRKEDTDAAGMSTDDLETRANNAFTHMYSSGKWEVYNWKKVNVAILLSTVTYNNTTYHKVKIKDENFLKFFVEWLRLLTVPELLHNKWLASGIS